MLKMLVLISAVGTAMLLGIPVGAQAQARGGSLDAPPALVAVAEEWRQWRAKGVADGGTDLAAQAEAQRKGVANFKRRLQGLNREGWSIPVQVDYLFLQSQMEQLEFNLSVIREVSRNPDYYVNQAVSAVTRPIGGRYQMGPGVTVPYDAERSETILAALNNTESILQQAPKHLTEAVGEMADMAIERLEEIRERYREFAQAVGPHLPEPYRAQIGPAADAAGAAMERYRGWLQQNRASFTRPHHIGREAFEWYTRRVLMMPFTSDELVTHAELERWRGWTFLQLERQKNRHLPRPGTITGEHNWPAQTNAEYSQWKDATDVLSRLWAEEHELFTKPDADLVGAMRHQDGQAVLIEPFGFMSFPTEERPAGQKTEFVLPPDHWFNQNYWNTGHRRDPGVNHPHSDYPGHTFEGRVSQSTARPLRRGHNTRGDAWTNYVEELQLQLEYPFVRGPKTREWMYSLHIMRAERVYTAVKFSEGAMTPKELGQHMMDSTPWMEPFVAHKHEVWRKYTQPAHVLTYQTGKTEIFKLLMDRMKQQGDQFNLREFHDALLATGQIPVSLARWEMTGFDDEIRKMGLFEPSPLPRPAFDRTATDNRRN